MILVTGGTGLVGSHLLYFLLKKDEPVRAIHRKNSDIGSVKKVLALYTSEVDLLFNKIEWVEANIIDIPALTVAFENITKVYHCAAFITFNPSKYKVLKKANVEGTANIVNLCLANKIEKICYVSSVATLGSNLNNRLITEETPWNPDEKNSDYAITKYGAEMEVWRGTQEGLEAVIVNPGVILGTSPDGGGSGVIISLGASGIPFYPTGAMGIVDVQDVVKVMVQLIDSDIKNEQFILVSENITYKELLSKLAPLFGKKPPTKKLSKRIMLFLSGMDWLSSIFFRTKRRIVKATVRSMFKSSLYDAEKIKKTLAFQFTPTEETLDRIVKERGGKLN
ncbi:NAD-dependent epimerase/dehydratase family protein [Aequorivita antarctica]|uniref:NAD-dependent epimerase/dehydratase family protein n=1 Tax=Aequorivita antarctica TaxID=153266 RepID=A0A5C6Z1N2_9FLAO|nr:NAD-dependent epimerase/dehydratase family protein [Aequorivita antarctica]TXD73954.1 NAD-dependent epimerase/dehydratase family protein [Aequorivita antarctica]SRX73326.1 Linear gramicidin synthase subunit D [Aequorivita antarctica]